MDGKFRTARKEHFCTFCELPIFRFTQYHWERITPWDHADNETFSTMRAHLWCIKRWDRVGDLYEWNFPNAYSWRLHELGEEPCAQCGLLSGCCGCTVLERVYGKRLGAKSLRISSSSAMTISGERSII